MFSERVDRCYDSHVHWAGIGEALGELKLNFLNRPEDVAELKVDQSHHLRGQWLVGYDWDQSSWTPAAFPHRHVLDQVFGAERPIAFFRADRHAVWVNSVALRTVGLMDEKGLMTEKAKALGEGQVLLDGEGRVLGILLDSAMQVIEEQLPRVSGPERRRHLMAGAMSLNRAGFTHIRDMTGDSLQWHESCHLADSGWLKLAVEQFFSTYTPENFDGALRAAVAAKREERPLLRVKGVKVFLDGSLGSESAWLSQSYGSGSGLGLQLIKKGVLVDFMRQCFEKKLDLAVHTIGDAAVDCAVKAYHEVKGMGLVGTLHLEHTELVRPETLELIKGQQIICHLQPSHWLSDRRWLREKVGSLFEFVFPWRAMQEAGIRFDFGSDAPIEGLSVEGTLRALEDSALSGVGKLLGDPLIYHSHPDAGWVANTFTLFKDGRPDQVVFNGEHLF